MKALLGLLAAALCLPTSIPVPADGRPRSGVNRLVVRGSVRIIGSGSPGDGGTVELRWPGNEDRFAPLTTAVREDGSYTIEADVSGVDDPAELTVTAIVPACELVETPLAQFLQGKGPLTIDLQVAPATLDAVLDIFRCCILNLAAVTVMLPAFLLGAAIAAFVPSQFLLSLLGPQAPKHKAYGAAVGSGMVLSLCSCNVIPLFVSIWRSGAGTGPAFAFLFAGPAINLVAIVFTCQVIGVPMGVFRVISVGVISVIVGLAMARMFGERKPDGAAPLASARVGPDMATTDQLLLLLLYLLVMGSFEIRPVRRLLLSLPAVGALAWLSARRLGWDALCAWMQETWRLLMRVIPILVPAVLIIGFMAQKVPLSATRWLSGSNSIGANLATSLFGALMYFPILTEVAFVKALLKVTGMGIGPGMALLLTAPGLSLPGMIIVSREIGWKRLAVYVGCIVGLAFPTGMLFGSRWGAYICDCLL